MKPAFTTTSFNNLKDVIQTFELNRKSLCHREASMKWKITFKIISIRTQLQKQLISEREKAQDCLLKLFTLSEYLAHQGL